MNTLFINGSAHTNGNTARFVKENFTDFETINLATVKVPPFAGQKTPDEASKIFEKMRNYDRIIIGSPVYFSGISGLTKTMIEWGSTQPRDFLTGRRIVAFVREMSANPSVDQPAYAIIKNFADYAGATFTTI
ncbi:flavodoxin family protein [Weissella cibaria]